ncbi:MAG: outer membrane protein transport protein [Ignavibacteriales bacterium]|nr:outer membrane protein transport protein [Ignavibacteriales bacterium]
MKLLPKFALVLGSSTQFVVSGGFQLNEHGARGIGMGGAYVARPFDGSAIFINPAGLSLLKGFQLYGGTTIISPSSRFRGHYPDNPVQAAEMKQNLFFPSHAYVTYSTEGLISAGIGFFNMYGLGSEWPEGWAGRALSEKVDLKTYFINPSLSVRVGETFSIGAGFSYIPASALIIRSIRTGFSDSTGAPVEPRITLDGSGSGFGWNIGILAIPTDELSVGFSYRSTAKLEFDGNATFEKVPPSLKTTFPDGPGRTSIKTPATFFFGAAYKVLQNLSVEADYQFVGWSTFDQLKFDLDNGINGQKEVTASRNYQDTYLLRFGIEYQMQELALRGGYILDKNPVPDGYVEPSLPDADRQDFTLGLSYQLSANLRFDASYMFVRFAQRTESRSIPEFSFNGTYNSSAHLLSVSVAYAFE